MLTFLRSRLLLHETAIRPGLNLPNWSIVGAGEMGRTVAQKLLDLQGFRVPAQRLPGRRAEAGETVAVDGGVPVLGALGGPRAVIEDGMSRGLHGPGAHELRARSSRRSRSSTGIRSTSGSSRSLPAPDPQGADPGPGRIARHLGRRSAPQGDELVRQADHGRGRFGPASRPPGPVARRRRPGQVDIQGPVFYHQERVGLDGGRFSSTSSGP